MSKFLDATCNALGVVTADGVVVPAAVVLSEGKQASTGVLLMEADKARYIPSSATDIKTVIEKLSDVLGSISGALTGLVGGPWSGPPPVIAPQIAEIAAIQGQLDALKEALK